MEIENMKFKFFKMETGQHLATTTVLNSVPLGLDFAQKTRKGWRMWEFAIEFVASFNSEEVVSVKLVVL